MKLLVTGASGFIGSHLLPRLVSAGYDLAVYTRTISVAPKGIISYAGDITDQRAIEECVSDFKPDVVVHLSADKNRSRDIDDFEDSIKTNLHGALYLIRPLLKLKNFNKLIVMGTAEEYGLNSGPFTEKMKEKPVSCYSLSKTMQACLAETISRIYRLPCVYLRPSVVYGPGQSTEMFLPSLITALANNQIFDMTMGLQTRDYIYIDDLLDAIMMAIQSDIAEFEAINIASGESISISKVANQVESIMGRYGLVKKGKFDQRKLEVMDYTMEITKAKKLLNWSPSTSFANGLQKTINYFCKTNETV